MTTTHSGSSSGEAVGSAARPPALQAMVAMLAAIPAVMLAEILAVIQPWRVVAGMATAPR